VIENEKLSKEILMEWYDAKLFSDFERKPEDSKKHYDNFILVKNDDFFQINYSFSFNHLSYREFGNVYNERCMTPF
jgi:hypothetical protein